MVLGSRNKDIGRILENIVYIELLRRGYTVRVGKMGEMEIGFVAVNGSKKEYYQVTAAFRTYDFHHQGRARAARTAL